MTVKKFIDLLRDTLPDWLSEIEDNAGQWVVKGFVDIHKKVYTISTDTKVISKIVELYLFPKILQFAKANNLEIELAPEQNFYPDITFRDSEGNLFALDVKSSYRKTDNAVNGFTLGAFTGYFRERNSKKNCKYPYGAYKAHIVLGVLYSANPAVNEQHYYDLGDLESIPSVLTKFQFFVQEKWKIATDRPGSGNTKNIGSITKIDDLISGNGVFSKCGQKVFDDYWMNYLTQDMARAAELKKPYYKNISEYKKFRGINDK